MEKRGIRFDRELSENELVFLEGNNRVYVKVAIIEFPSESAIKDELVYASRVRGKYNKVYIALPKSSRGFIDGRLFKSHWVGVLLYDTTVANVDNAVEELIPSIPLEIHGESINAEVLARIERLERIVDELKAVLSSALKVGDSMAFLNRELSELKNRISRIERDLEALRERLVQVKAEVRTEEAPKPEITALASAIAESTPSSGELPDFISDNPWIDVLKRRG